MEPLSTFGASWRVVCWFSLGIPFFVAAFAIRQGRFNRWYLHTQLVPYMPPATMYGLIPMGLALSLPPLILILPFFSGNFKYNLILVIGAVCLILAGFVFPMWKPDFLKPTWLRKLESEYPPDVIEFFVQEWKEMDKDEWARKIGTEEGMEELIRLVAD